MAKSEIKSSSTLIPDALIQTICERLREGKRVRRTFPSGGRVHIDRQVPFLCAYRRTPESEKLGMQNLVTSEAAYLYASSERYLFDSLQRLVNEIAGVMVEQFGAFLLLEIWPAKLADDRLHGEDRVVGQPSFCVVSSRGQVLGDFQDKLIESLTRVRIDGRHAKVDVETRAKVAPPKLKPLLSAAEAAEMKCLVLGLEISPVFADSQTGEVFPLVRRQFERRFTIALKHAFFEFARTRTTHRPPHYHSLGRRATVKAVWRTDKRLAIVANSFDFLLQVSPINVATAWREFRRSKYKKPPTFHYRPLPIDPILLKRSLYDTPVERVEDPAIGQLFRNKLLEIDRQLSMLLELNRPQFIHGSIQLYGGVEDSLLQKAEAILQRLPKSQPTKSADLLDASAFANYAAEEIAFLQRQDPDVNARIDIRSDVSGLIVSHGSLLIGTETAIPRDRVNALIQHEIGTHVLTYFNGRAQPFRQLASGLSGYEALQEGIAVLSEFLVGGLDSNRMRLLAARVVAVRMLIDGASFVECFDRLKSTYRFSDRGAFNLTMRVFRGGGLTKDAIYLRGLSQTLEYLGGGGDLEPLLIGKISAEHISLIKELRWRKVLTSPKIMPRYLSNPDARERLERVRGGMDVLDLIARKEN